MEARQNRTRCQLSLNITDYSHAARDRPQGEEAAVALKRQGMRCCLRALPHCATDLITYETGLLVAEAYWENEDNEAAEL
jgi:hypothetical protein